VKKDTLVKGTLILAAAALVARALGVVQRVPLEYVLNNLGDAYFSVANNVYLFFLVVATAGIPSAISKMVSERYALGKPEEARQVYRAALLFGAAAGVLITLLLYALAPFIANNMMNRPGAATAIRAIAPSLLLFPTIAMMRGYFQGRQFMTAGGISQIVEQILRVVAAVGIGFTFYAWHKSDEWIAAGAAFGSVLGSIGAFVVMLYYARKLSQNDSSVDSETGTRKVRERSRLRLSSIYREMFRLSVPIVLTAVTVQLFYTIDTTILPLLAERRYAPQTIDFWLAVLGNRAQSIAGIPVILAVALSQSIIPIISSANATGDRQRVGRQSSLAVRIAMYSGMPIVLLFSVGAYSVNGLLYSSDEGSLIVGLLTFGTIFQVGMMVTNSILLGLGKPKKAMVHAIAGIVLKIALSAAFTAWLGVYGIIAATTLSFLFIYFFNVLSLRRLTEFRIIGNRWPAFFAIIAFLSAVAWGVQWLMLDICHTLPLKIGFLFSTAAMGLAVFGLYPVLLVLLKLITPEEAAGYPRPLRRLLAPILRLGGKAAVKQMES
jgi:stage V sporulation protein B